MKRRGSDGRFMASDTIAPIPCACGCGQLTTVYKGKNRKFISGHNSLVKNPFAGKKHDLKTKKIMSQKKIGKRPWNFNDGIYGKERHRAMGTLEYKLWRKAVFERDNYTCQMCFERGGKLEADHIKPWAVYPELRYAIDNGRALCHDCHQKTDTYGRNVMFRLKENYI